MEGNDNAFLFLHDFQVKIEQKYDMKFDNYLEFQKWTIKNSTTFWAEIWDYFQIIYSEPYTQVVEHNKDFEEVPIWFPGARLNYAENILRNNYSDDLALIIAGEERKEPEFVTFNDLKDEVAVLTSAMRKSGIEKGDTVACFMSNRKEAVVSMLATASVGAVFTSTNPLMGPQAVIHRFQQVMPKVLFTIDRYLYDGEEKNILQSLPEIVNGLSDLQYVIVVSSDQKCTNKNISPVKHSCYYHEFLKIGLLPDDGIPDPYYEQLSFSHPFLINFTSGTSGAPKGLVHSIGAALLFSLQSLCFYADMRKSDVTWSIFSPGWVTFHVFINALQFGASTVIYEGQPFHHNSSAFWDMVDKFAVTNAMLSSPTLEDMLKHQLIPGPHNSLESLRTITTGGCFVKGHLFDFVHNQIKRHVNLGIIYGATEFCSMIGGFVPELPVNKEEIQLISLGLDLCCYNEKGESIEDEYGELVITNTFPSMPLYIWNDQHNEKYRSSIFDMFPGVWRIGDVGKINSKTHGLSVIGRSDETIKQRGARFGSSDVYSIVNKIENVVDCICVSKLTQNRDEIAVLFIKICEGCLFTHEMELSIRNAISIGLSYRHVPEIILPVKDIPYNLNKKKMEVLVKKILAKSSNISTEAASNPECLQEYIDLALIIK